MAIAVLVLAGGCLQPLPFGSPPRQARLEQLKEGVSTPPDVLLVLGEPRGDGVLRFSPSLAPRTVWYYEYVEVGMSKLETKILLVFFYQDRYDGYVWFSSAALLNKE